MSSVRMCDKCKTVFSENDEGWQTFTAQTIEYDERGGQQSVPLRQDLCPTCAIQVPSRGSKAKAQADTIAQLEATNRKLDELTRQIEATPTG